MKSGQPKVRAPLFDAILLFPYSAHDVCAIFGTCFLMRQKKCWHGQALLVDDLLELREAQCAQQIRSQIREVR